MHVETRPAPLAGTGTQRLSLLETIGYSAGDAAANFVFLTMVLFQANFYTDVFGISAAAAAVVLLIARMWDGVIDPVVGYLADRTRSRWGKFRPWILATAIPWAILMVLAYTTPSGLSTKELIAYAVITNALLMSVYSMNNMPYAALGSVITADLHERAKLNACRFISVNVAQFVAGGLTLPLVAKFSIGHDRQYGWQTTISIWAVLCVILFLITFATTRERVQSPSRPATGVKVDVATLLRCKPWRVLLLLTLFDYALLTFRGAALYDYYHYYATRPAMYEVLRTLGLTLPTGARPSSDWTRLLSMLGYLVRGEGGRPASANVADVFNSIINVLNTVVTILVLLVSPALARTFGRKAVSVVGFALAGVCTALFYVLRPTDAWGMIGLTAVIAACYAPTIPLLWTMYADVTDYIEWTTGRRLDGVTFATIGVVLKFGLACGSSAFLWSMVSAFGYRADAPYAAGAVQGFKVSSSLITGLLLGLCALIVTFYPLDRKATRHMADGLAANREQTGLDFGLANGEEVT